ncbi:MAG: ABC transporter permease [Oscillospiraceae bacterium]|jgi:spermidine/putrescine transport system permease protein|nr:ABC transporter permease [Oscillospiraceae bacterium]
MTKKKRAGGRVYTYFIMLFLYAPIFVLIAFSFNESNSRTVWTGFTLKWYRDLLADKSIMSSFYTTISVSALAAAVATVAGTLSAVGLFNMKRRWRAPILTVNNIPLINADIITGVGMCLLFVSLGSALKFRLGFGTLLIAHITFNIPYVILSVMPKLRQLDENLVDAAQDLGCTWFRAFRKVIIPEILPGIVNGAMIAFTMSIDDFVISYFTAGSGVMTLSMKVFSMTRKRVSPKINALSSLMFAAVLLLLLAVNIRELRQEEKRKRENRGLSRPS